MLCFLTGRGVDLGEPPSAAGGEGCAAPAVAFTAALGGLLLLVPPTTSFSTLVPLVAPDAALVDIAIGAADGAVVDNDAGLAILAELLPVKFPLPTPPAPPR